MLALKPQVVEPLVYRLPQSHYFDSLPYADESISNRELKEAYKLVKEEMKTFANEERDYLRDFPMPQTSFIDFRLQGTPPKEQSSAQIKDRESRKTKGVQGILEKEVEVMRRMEYATAQYLNMEIMRLHGKDLKQLCLFELEKTHSTLQKEIEGKEDSLRQIHAKRKFFQVFLKCSFLLLTD